MGASENLKSGSVPIKEAARKSLQLLHELMWAPPLTGCKILGKILN